MGRLWDWWWSVLRLWILVGFLMVLKKLLALGLEVFDLGFQVREEGFEGHGGR